VESPFDGSKRHHFGEAKLLPDLAPMVGDGNARRASRTSAFNSSGGERRKI
jgi:hypothetical protein